MAIFTLLALLSLESHNLGSPAASYQLNAGPSDPL